jgi:hypothetical protein
MLLTIYYLQVCGVKMYSKLTKIYMEFNVYRSMFTILKSIPVLTNLLPVGPNLKGAVCVTWCAWTFLCTQT